MKILYSFLFSFYTKVYPHKVSPSLCILHKKRKIKKNGKRFERHDDDGDDVKVKKVNDIDKEKKMIEKRVLNDRQHGKKEMGIETTRKQKSRKYMSL